MITGYVQTPSLAQLSKVSRSSEDGSNGALQKQSSAEGEVHSALRG